MQLRLLSLTIKQIEKFLQTGVIETTTYCEGEYMYISNIFIRPKKDGLYHPILNLNQFVQYRHFKMENLKSAITLMSTNCYMASIDLICVYRHKSQEISPLYKEEPVVSVYLSS